MSTGDSIRAQMEAAYAAMAARCTCPGGWDHHDDEADCPASAPCACGRYFNPWCLRHGDPERHTALDPTTEETETR